MLLFPFLLHCFSLLVQIQIQLVNLAQCGDQQCNQIFLFVLNLVLLTILLLQLRLGTTQYAYQIASSFTVLDVEVDQAQPEWAISLNLSHDNIN